MTGRRLLIGGGIAAAMVAALLVSRGRDAAPAAAAPASPEQARWPALPAGATPAAPRLAWADATRYQFDLSWHARQEARIGSGDTAQVLAGTCDVEATLIARNVGHDGDLTLVAVSLEQLVRHDLVVLGQPLLPDEAAAVAALGADEAVLEIAASGQVRGVRVAPEAQPLFVDLVGALAAELSMTLPATPAADWQAEEATALGVAEVRYVTVDGARPAIGRSRDRYLHLSGLPDSTAGARAVVRSRGDIVIDQAGTLRSLREDDQVAVSGPGDALWAETTLALTLIGTEPAEPEELLTAGWRRLAPGQIVPADDDAATLAQRIGGMTAERMIDQLVVHGATGTMPDHDRWLWQATGLLVAQPDLCARLVPLFGDERLGPDGRALVLDLLAGAGHAQAQAAMRAILDGPALAATELPALVQRFSLVAAPTGDTVAFLAARLESGAPDSDARSATAYALGSVAGHVAEPAAAQAIEAQLRDALGDADDDRERAVMIAALGNSRLDAALPLLIGRADADAAEVRRAVADALYGYDDAGAIATLIGLLDDGDLGVQHGALTSLDQRDLGAVELGAIAEQLFEGRLASAVDDALINLLAHRLADAPVVAEMLRFVRERHLDQGALLARIDGLLAAAA